MGKIPSLPKTLSEYLLLGILMFNFMGYMCAIVYDAQCSSEEIQYIEKLCGNIDSFAETTSEMTALYDILPKICSYLKIRDLHSMSQTCKMLLEAAKYELLRRGPEIHILPIRDIDEGGSDFADAIGVRPKTAIFFTNDATLQDAHDSVSRELMSHYWPRIPQDCTVVHLEGLAAINNQSDVDASKNNALGLFLPEILDNDRKRVTVENYMLAKPGSIPFHAIGIMLSKYFGQNYRKTVAVLMFNRQKPREESNINSNNARSITQLENEIIRIHSENSGGLSVWGGNIQWIAGISPDDLELYFSHAFYMTTISGPGVDTWSIYFDLTWPKSVIEKKLQAFKNKIFYKTSKSVALSLQTTFSEEGHEQRLSKNQHFIHTFPDLKILSFGLNPQYPKYCLDSLPTTHEINRIPKIKHSERSIMCYIVISYR